MNIDFFGPKNQIPSLQTSKELINNKNNGIDIVFENINYSVKIPDLEKKSNLPFRKVTKQKEILKGISGIFKAKQVTAIMGASGAGKTTLLNVLACRIKPSQGAKLYANNFEYDSKSFGNFANYVMQTDRLMETLTVRQTLLFAAKLKLNAQTKDEQKRRVNDLVKRMKLQKCLDTLVGGIILKGISGGQKKRVSIAFELISDPFVLFLDEPTSGLDSLTSYIIVSELKKLAHRENKTVIMTIHQPGTETYELFDNLIILIDGRIMYQNEASMITNYFQKHFNLPCPQFMNPPDFFMSQIHFESQSNCEKFTLYFETYETFENPSIKQNITQKSKVPPPYRNTTVPYLVALSALLKRSMINTLRNPHLIHAKLIQVLVMALYSGGVYFGMGNKDYTDYQSWLTVSGFFFCISFASVVMSISPVALTFPQQRLVFLKEQENRMYNTTQYFVARNIIEIPEHLILPILAIPIYYFMTVCAHTPEQFFLHCLICSLMSFCGGSIGLFIGSVIMDWKDIPVVIPIFLLPMIAFSGFFKNRQDLPAWCVWLQYISPNKYSFIALLQNEVQHRYSLIGRFNFDIQKWETIWFMLALGVAFRMGALFFLWFFRKKSQ